jgi:hypothetical protein
MDQLQEFMLVVEVDKEIILMRHVLEELEEVEQVMEEVVMQHQE